jgi:hypothetical protein
MRESGVSFATLMMRLCMLVRIALSIFSKFHPIPYRS